MSEIRPHFKDSNDWDSIDEVEIDRLQKTLHPHLKKININMKKEERIEFVKQILKNTFKAQFRKISEFK